jgi:YaaC-like protein
MAWWGVLFTLSMLARYQPDQWGAHINVDAGQYAVALERVLAAARTQPPDLILETLREVQ